MKRMIFRYRPRLPITPILFLGLLFALMTNLETTPPVWWDEGWTMSVARNWVELGHYGRLQNGKLVARGFEGGLPVVSSVAASFLLFGVGLYQARFVFVVYTLAALAVLYYLARRVYNRQIAAGTIAILVLLSSHVDVNPLIMGRQVLGEIPAMFFLLCGFVCLLVAGEKSGWFIAAASLFWSIALVTKAQVQPFWFVSLVIPALFAVYQQNWRLVGLLSVGLCGSYILSLAWLQVIYGLESIHRPPLSGLTEVIALALNRHSRAAVLMETWRFGIPTLLGLSWGLLSLARKSSRPESHIDLVRIALFVLAVSWFAWYEFLSIGWPRYMFPPVFLGSIFVAAMLSDWTDCFKLKSTLKRAAGGLRDRHFSRSSVCALAAVVLIALSLARTGTILYGAYVVTPDSSVKQVIRFLNTRTAPEALIETYESELFAFLDRRYHYPADQITVELIRKNSFGENVTIDYDPLAADPDYLVVGQQNRFWDFYDPYIASGAFRPIAKFSRYQIYERVRGNAGASSGSEIPTS